MNKLWPCSETCSGKAGVSTAGVQGTSLRTAEWQGDGQGSTERVAAKVAVAKERATTARRSGILLVSVQSQGQKNKNSSTNDRRKGKDEETKGIKEEAAPDNAPK